MARGSVSEGRRSRNKGLDGLRGIAILLVVASHVSTGRVPLGGAVGVTLFFVLSGYLITTVLLREYDKTGRVDLPTFYLKRALRLLPALAVVLVLAPVVLWAVQDPRLGWGYVPDAAGALFYLSDFMRASGNEMIVLGHTWSLAVEEQFYLVWPILLLILLKFAKGRKRLIQVVAVMAIVGTGWRVVVTLTASFDRAYFPPDVNTFALAWGCLLALWAPAPLSRPRATVVAGASLLGLLVLSLAPIQGGRYSTIVALSAVPAALLSVIAVYAARTSALVSIRPLTFFGDISYGLYLWHEVFLLSRPGGKLPGTAELALGGMAGLLASVLSWQLIERPANRLKDRIGSKAGAAPEPAA